MTCPKPEPIGPRRRQKGMSRSALPTTPAPPAARWDRDQIQRARKTPRPPLLRRIKLVAGVGDRRRARAPLQIPAIWRAFVFAPPARVDRS